MQIKNWEEYGGGVCGARINGTYKVEILNGCISYLFFKQMNEPLVVKSSIGDCWAMLAFKSQKKYFLL